MRARFSLVLLCAAALVVPACGGHKGPPQLGLRRLDLDLIFKDQSKAAPPPSIRQIMEAQQPLATAGPVFGALAARPPSSGPEPMAPLSPSPLGSAASACPAAKPGAVPAEPVTGIVGAPPAAGLYAQHNTGTYSLDRLNLKGDFPPVTAMEITNVKDVTAPDITGQAARTITFDVVEHSLLSTTTTSYQSTATELDLVSTSTVANGQTSTFTPTPVITMMQYSGEGSFWKSAGIDQATGTSMIVQGTVDKRESVDVCGTMIDTYRVVSSERVTNVGTGYDSQTDPNDPNVYNVATQFGGLMVRQHINTTTTFTVNGSLLTLALNYTSTVDSAHPRAAKSTR